MQPARQMTSTPHSSPPTIPSSGDEDGPPSACALDASPPDLSGSDSVPALAGRCCPNDCLAQFEAAPELREHLDIWRQWVAGVSHEHHLDHVFQLLLDLSVASGGSRRKVYRFLGRSVCRRGWARLVQVSAMAVTRMMQAVRGGLAQRPRDGRCCNGRDPEEGLSVGAFLEDTYNSVAEWMPAATDVVAPAVPALSEWLAAPAGPSATAATVGRNGVRYLAHPSIQDLFYTYQSQESPRRAASYATFLRIFKSWRHKMVFVKAGDHSKCPDCEHFKELNRRATARSDQDAILKSYRLHLAAQYSDRAVAAHLSLRSRASVRGEVPSQESLLVLCMDGMDQAKFRAPRNTSQSKDLTGRQRPQLHCVGAIVDGVADFYYFNDLRVSTDANLQITLLARTLGVVVDILETRPGARVPRHLVVHSDNASGEGKHQTVMKFCAWLVWCGIFETATMTQFRVGHTHNAQGQRFAVVAGALNAQQVLEDCRWNRWSAAGPVYICVCGRICGFCLYRERTRTILWLRSGTMCGSLPATSSTLSASAACLTGSRGSRRSSWMSMGTPARNACGGWESMRSTASGSSGVRTVAARAVGHGQNQLALEIPWAILAM